jgi:hypothetical protein
MRFYPGTCLSLVVITLVGVLCGCNKLSPERAEAVKFCKLLTNQQKVLATADSQRRFLIERLKPWGQRIRQFGGADEAIAESRVFMNNGETIQESLEKAYEALKTADLRTSGNQTLRSSLLPPLDKRKEEVKQLNMYVKGCFQTFPQGGPPRIPRAVLQLNQLLETNQPWEDIITPAIKELRTKYEITDAEASP